MLNLETHVKSVADIKNRALQENIFNLTVMLSEIIVYET